MTAVSAKQFIPPLLLSIATIAIYAVTGSFELLFSWDDRLYLIQNETINGFTVAHLKEAFSNYYVGNYAPLNILSYMLDHLLWGLRPVGYHLENGLLHLANGLLFYMLLRRHSLSEWQACSAAWIFLFHPVQVETVAWVSQRKSLLAMIFFLIALIAYQTYAEQQANRLRYYLLSVASLAAALLSKSVAVILPAALVLYDLTYDHNGMRSAKHRILDKIPFLAVSLGFGVIAIISQSQQVGGGRRDYPGGSPLATIYTMVPVLLSYLRDCFWPNGLSPYYVTIIRQQPDAVFAVALIALLLLAAFGSHLFRTARPLFFWFTFYFIALAPVLQFVPLVTLKNDRYLYMPMLGLAVFVVLCAKQLQKLIPANWHRPYRWGSVIIMLTLPLLTFKQTLYWRNDVTIWKRAAAVDPENSVAWLQLAKAYTVIHDSDNSAKAFNRYYELRNRYGPVRGFEKY